MHSVKHTVVTWSIRIVIGRPHVNLLRGHVRSGFSLPLREGWHIPRQVPPHNKEVSVSSAVLVPQIQIL